MALDLSSPYLQTGEDILPVIEDPYTVALRDQMNAVTAYQPTQPPVFNTWVRSYGPGVGDENYNVGYHHLPVPSGIEPLLIRHEAPEIPVTHLPFMQQIYNTTLVRELVAGQVVYPSLRAPGINEGFA